jgi:hypothetical protein
VTWDSWLNAKIVEAAAKEQRAMEMFDRIEARRNTMTGNQEQSFENAILSEMKGTIADLRRLATDINRGAGGREVSLAITNMQYAQWSLEEAIRLMKEASH